MAKISFERVTKRYQKIIALNDCSLEIQDKDFFVFLGPTQSGKSTALRCLLGVEEVTTGQIWINERNITALPPRERHLETVNSSYALFPHLSIYENLGWSLTHQDVSGQALDQRIKKIAVQLGLIDLLNSTPEQVTNEQRLRTSIGRVMIQEPAAFILDEPIAGLDGMLQAKFIETLAALWQLSNLTFVFATSDSQNAFTLGTRIALLRDGDLQQVDTPQNLFKHPANAFVSEFIHSK